MLPATHARTHTSTYAHTHTHTQARPYSAKGPGMAYAVEGEKRMEVTVSTGLLDAFAAWDRNKVSDFDFASVSAVCCLSPRSLESMEMTFLR